MIGLNAEPLVTVLRVWEPCQSRPSRSSNGRYGAVTGSVSPGTGSDRERAGAAM
jgi:hypothetical protein